MEIYLISILFYMDGQIEQVYKKFNYTTNVQKLLKLSQAAGIAATAKDIKSFLDKRVSVQQTKITKKSKSNEGHIVAFKAFDLLQMDIFVMEKYNKSNKGYGYIFAIVDVFSRKAYAYPMKHKALEDTTEALTKFFNEPDVKKYKKGISVIISDSDSAFLGGKDQGEARDFQQVMDKNNAIHDTVKIGDHSALGIIDRFARTLKTVFTRMFLENGSTTWVSELETVIRNYNGTPSDALDNHSPNKTLTDEDIRIDVLHINMNKNLKNIQIHRKGSDLAAGDNVRISEKNAFAKGTEPRWSDDVYTVEGVKGLSVTLSDRKAYKRDKLLKIPKDTIKITNSDNKAKANVIKTAKKQRKQELILKAEDIKEENIVKGARERVPNKQMSAFVMNSTKKK